MADGVAGLPAGLAVHASSVAIGSRALLIVGRSGSGKSRLAFALTQLSGRGLPVVLVGDDRVLLDATVDGIRVRPHPRIAGFVERRGLGLVATPWRPRALVAGLAILDGAGPRPACLDAYPARVWTGAPAAHDVLDWWHDAAGKRQRDESRATARLIAG